MGGIPAICSDPLYGIDPATGDVNVAFEDTTCDGPGETRDTGALPPSTADAADHAREAARSLPPVPVGTGTGVFAPRRIPSTGEIFTAENRRNLEALGSDGAVHSVTAHEVTGREKFAGMANGAHVGNYTVVRVGERVFLAQTDQPHLASVASSGSIRVTDDSV